MHKLPLMCVIAASLAMISLASCGFDLFDTKQLADGYELIATDMGGYALSPPHQRGGPLVADVGWRKPYIISRDSGDSPWDVIDTSTGKKVTLSETQRLEDARFRDLPIYNAKIAWNKLNYRKRQW